MDNIQEIEKYFEEYIRNLPKYLPEGAMNVDIQLLKRLKLLNYYDSESNDDALTSTFHVIESHDKITLVNDDFIIWIVADKLQEVPFTYTLIALNHPEVSQLELCFVATGVYNTSRLVLRVLEKLLFEIQENEDSLKPYL